MSEQRILILGAAGRDFHNFNLYFRDNKNYKVVAFTATQIPGIDDRKYPASLAGSLYPNGISIEPEAEMVNLIKKHGVNQVIFAYSDVPHTYVMHKAAEANAAGADFVMMGVERTMIKSTKPVVAICAIRTGCGKSQTSRYVAERLKAAGKKVVIVRHPMPYGDLTAQAVQRFSSYDDLAKHKCTIEEREEYESHLEMGTVVYAGVDYGKILEKAQAEADVVIWDGGNNDTPFFKPDLWITVVDPLRPGHEMTYYPGETNLRSADIIVINKANVAKNADIDVVCSNIASVNSKAIVIRAASKLSVEDESKIRGKRVLTVEDGPTVTHGEMPFGAADIAAKEFGAASVVDARSVAVGSIKETFKKYPHLGTALPAMGYSDKQVAELEQTINAVTCDTVVFATPIDLGALVKINKPSTRVRYELADMGGESLGTHVDMFLKKHG